MTATLTTQTRRRSLTFYEKEWNILTNFAKQNGLSRSAALRMLLLNLPFDHKAEGYNDGE